jgi:hypothetical protein
MKRAAGSALAAHSGSFGHEVEILGYPMGVKRVVNWLVGSRLRSVVVAVAATAVLALVATLAGMPRHSMETSPDPGPKGPLLFADYTDEVGLRFTHDAGPVPQGTRYFLPQIVGSGAAVFDFDGDGLLDLYLLTNGGPDSPATNRLYRQLPGGRFEDVTAGSGLDLGGYNMGVAIGDVNNDGLPDVLVTRYTGLRLFLNLGGGRFRDITHEAGLEGPLWGTSAAFFDYDRDGWLDLVVANYLEYDPTRVCAIGSQGADYCPPQSFTGQVATLFHNLGPTAKGAVAFQDITLAAGLGRPGFGLGVVCADFTGDGWPDIFVANDGFPNFLWVNRHDGTFIEEAVPRGLAYNVLGQQQANMGVALGDVDGDGLLDLFVTHESHENHTLWRQGPRGVFRDRTGESGLAAPRWKGTGFGTVLADFDHDGNLDLALVNGRVHRGKAPGPGPFWESYAQRSQLFLNQGGGRFEDVSPANDPFCSTLVVGRGLAWLALDGDGAVHLLRTEVGGPARLFRNVAAKKGQWLLVRAVDPELGGRDVYGAEVVVRAGGRRWVGLVNPATSYLCSNDPRVHFGLGTVDRVDGIEVTWPDGSREEFPASVADRLLVLPKGGGRGVHP